MKLIPDYKREAFTRMRVMSHSLRIETGRWSRTPSEQRVCQCDENSVQTERHVLIQCRLSEASRARYPMLCFDNIKVLLNETVFLYELCAYVHEVTDIFTQLWYSHLFALLIISLYFLCIRIRYMVQLNIHFPFSYSLW